MKTISKVGLGMVGLLAASVLQAAPAHADIAGQAGDIVGVGSDTAQYGLDFLIDGDVAGNIGFNNTSLSRRVLNFQATGDAYGALTVNAGAPLRVNSKPRTRPNGSGAGITQLLADTGANRQINYVRSSRLPNSGEQTTASAPALGWGGLHVYQFANDGMKVAVSQTTPTNAPAGISVADLVKIYECTWTTWGQIPTYTGPAPTATIAPLIPQTGSGTRNFFIADLTAAKGSAVTLGGCVNQSVQEHDPSLIKNNANAIAPFSVGRFNLFASGYFANSPTNPTSGVALLSGAGTYSVVRPLYVIVRASDVTSTTPFLPGGTQNFVKTLFDGPFSWMGNPDNAALISSAGLTPAYVNLGIVSG